MTFDNNDEIKDKTNHKSGRIKIVISILLITILSIISLIIIISQYLKEGNVRKSTTDAIDKNCNESSFDIENVDFQQDFTPEQVKIGQLIKVEISEHKIVKTSSTSLKDK